MDYNEYRELKNSIDAYLETDNRQTLVSIQNCIETNEECRKKIIKELMEYHERYIQVFSVDDQVKIVSNLVAQIKQEDHLAYRISWLLPYVSEQALEKILSTADDVALVKIMHEIKRHIRVIGNRLCDSPTYFWLDTTNIFSRMCEKIMWRNLYRKCERNLNK